MMQARGFSPRAVLANTRIDARRLSDPAYLVEPAQCHAVVANMLRLSDDPALGLEIGSKTLVTDLGIVGHAMASSTTLGQAIGLWVQYGNSPIGFPFTLELSDDRRSGHWGATATSTGYSNEVFRFYVEETFAVGFALALQLVGTPLRPLKMSFSYPAPKHRARYEDVFGCHVTFDAERTAVTLRAPRFDTPIRGSDQELRELCIRHCQDLVRQIGRSGGVAERLRATLRAHGVAVSLADAAERLNISPRTLRRQLQMENTSYQQVVDRFRRDLAREYLGVGMIPAKEVAFLLGYSNPNTFRTAFKAWTGQTVGAYQAAYRAGASAGKSLRTSASSSPRTPQTLPKSKITSDRFARGCRTTRGHRR